MLIAEDIFVITTIVLLIVLGIFLKNIPWSKLGLKVKQWQKGWIMLLLFNTVVFILVQFSLRFVDFPDWVTDQDPILRLLLGVILQEVIFRSILITWLERFGRQKALLISTVLFASIHLALPDPWFLTGLSLIGGYVWGWHFLKYRNLYWLIISHLLVNLSFNYIFLSNSL